MKCNILKHCENLFHNTRRVSQFSREKCDLKRLFSVAATLINFSPSKCKLKAMALYKGSDTKGSDKLKVSTLYKAVLSQDHPKGRSDHEASGSKKHHNLWL